MATTVVIGAGLFGNIIAKALRRIGMHVITTDARYEKAGSPPAACLMRPGWYSALGKTVYEPSLRLLDELYGVEDVRFRVLRGHVSVHWCRPNKILQPPDSRVQARRLESNGTRWVVHFENHGPLPADYVVVAAGIWCHDILPLQYRARVPLIVGQAGLAVLWSQEVIDEPFINVWAPYRQLVAFNRGDGLWVGDGTAIRERRWTEQYRRQVLARCQRAVGGVTSLPQELLGLRPYVKGVKPCYLEELAPGLWVATGGAKNGTLAAGWCAHQIATRVQ